MPPDLKFQYEKAPCECGRGEKTGYPWGDGTLWTACAECQLEKREAEDRQAEERAESERQAEQKKRLVNAEHHMERIGVNRLYRRKYLGEFDPSHDASAYDATVDLVERFKEGERPSLYLYSERPGETIAPGSGKTHLAVGALRVLASDPVIPLDDLSFVFVPRLLLEIQATFKNPERSELEVVERYARPELLVWDDFGAEKLSDYAARTLYTLLYEREGRSNIFTSNLSLADVETRDPSGYTQRITSRIAGDARIVRMTGPDRRIKPRAA